VPGLSFLDVRLLMRIVGDAVLVEGGSSGRRKFLLRSVAELISADTWGWRYQELGSDGTSDFFIGGKKSLLPKSFSDIIETTSHIVSHLKAISDKDLNSLSRSPATTGPRVHLSSCGKRRLEGLRVEEMRLSTIIFVRGPRSRPFTERESKIVNILIEEVSWLSPPGHTPQSPPGMSQMSPRKQEVAKLLVSGQGRQDIAETLGISVHTTHTYIKSIYRAYRVNSQASLTRLFADTKYGK
jgi:DNA-binding CsgD family transcriptional regulator